MLKTSLQFSCRWYITYRSSAGALVAPTASHEALPFQFRAVRPTHCPQVLFVGTSPPLALDSAFLHELHDLVGECSLLDSTLTSPRNTILALPRQIRRALALNAQNARTREETLHFARFELVRIVTNLPI